MAARRAEVRTSGPNLVPPRSMWNKCFGRRKRTTIFCTGCWGLAKTPRGRSAALSGELGGRGTFRGTARGSVATPPVPAQCVRRPGRGGRRNGYFKRLPWSKVGLLKTSAQSEDFVTIKGVRAGSSRENLRFSSWMSDQYKREGLVHPSKSSKLKILTMSKVPEVAVERKSSAGHNVSLSRRMLLPMDDLDSLTLPL